MTPQVVAAGLNAAVPATIAFPVGIIEILTAFAPPAPAIRGTSCTLLPLNICVTGTAEYCTTADPNTTDWVFTNCVDDEGTNINGTASVNTVDTTVTVIFPSSGFTIGGNPVTGQMTINALSSVQFLNLGITVEGSSVTVNGGPLNIADQTVNSVTQMSVQDLIFVPFQAAVTINNNNIIAIVSDSSTTPPTVYTCTGSLSYSDGDFFAKRTYVEGVPG